MLRPTFFSILCAIYLLCCRADAGQESFKMLELHEQASLVFGSVPRTDIPLAVSVSNEDLTEVSASVVMAESWVRTHVLAYFPAAKITTIVVGRTVLCNRDHEEKWGLLLPCVKNIYYSLVRWGLEKEIKVTTAFSADCLEPHSVAFRDDLAEGVIKPLLDFLQNANSTYSVNRPADLFPSLSDDTLDLVSAHSESMKKLGFFNLNDITVIVSISKEKKPMSRKLSVIEPFPARPTPFPELPPSPIHSSIGFSDPAPVARNPLPPLSGDAPQPAISFPSTPEGSPVMGPSNPPEIPTLPPCSAVDMGAPAPQAEKGKGLWCVSKPTVPADTLQEALDYACGQGGADCEEIRPHGSCYYPNTVVAHSSYAFNSFWQKSKKNGGTCSFGGTAMIINADPSYLHCRFLLS